MKLNSKRFLGFQEYQSILLLDVTLTTSLSQFVYTACNWFKAVVGKDGCVGKVVGREAIILGISTTYGCGNQVWTSSCILRIEKLITFNITYLWTDLIQIPSCTGICFTYLTRNFFLGEESVSFWNQMGAEKRNQTISLEARLTQSVSVANAGEIFKRCEIWVTCQADQ